MNQFAETRRILALDDMVGCKINALVVKNQRDGSLLDFVCGPRIIRWAATGDCCSESWFADVAGVDALIDREVTAVEEIPLPDWVNVDDGRGRQEEDKAYGYRITTTHGYCDVVFRNSSNGYYGGWMTITEEASSTEEGVEIREDWHA
jgi:hypothetical protein